MKEFNTQVVKTELPKLSTFSKSSKYPYISINVVIC